VAWFFILGGMRSACRAICKAFARRNDRLLRVTVFAPNLREGDMYSRGYLVRKLAEKFLESAGTQRMTAGDGRRPPHAV